MKLLELFSGTKSVSKAIGYLYDDIISLDILEKNNPTFVCDILSWDYKQYPPYYFDTIWASPPCTEYSKILYGRPNRLRNLELANKIVLRTIEIIDYFKPNKWFIENPETGLLKEQEFMLGIPFYDVDYCRYSMFGYRKRTRIWSNIDDFTPKLCNKKCGNMIGNKHIKSCGRTFGYTIPSLQERYRIPELLIYDLFGL